MSEIDGALEQDVLLVRFSRRLLETLITRDEEGNRLHLTVGEPDAQGVYSPVVTTDHADNPLRARLRELDQAAERCSEDGLCCDTLQMCAEDGDTCSPCWERYLRGEVTDTPEVLPGWDDVRGILELPAKETSE